MRPVIGYGTKLREAHHIQPNSLHCFIAVQQLMSMPTYFESSGDISRGCRETISILPSNVSVPRTARRLELKLRDMPREITWNMWCGWHDSLRATTKYLVYGMTCQAALLPVNVQAQRWAHAFL